MNQLGPVLVIACGIFAGYLVLSGRASGVLSALGGGASTTAAGSDPSSPPGVPGGSSVGSYAAYSPASALAVSQANLQSVMATGVYA